MSQPQIRMTTSYALNQPYNTNFNFNKLSEACLKMGIKLSKFSDTQLEATYCMQGFKAVGSKSNEISYIFISLYDNNSLHVFSYYNGTLIQNKDFANQNQIPQFIASSLKMVRQNFPLKKSTQEQYKQLQRLFQNLNKKSEQILKSSNNQMIAVQQIKISPEYMAVCNYAKNLTEETKKICQASMSRQNSSKLKNQTLLRQMLQIQQAKQKLHQNIYKYTQLMKQANNVEGLLQKIINNKKQRGIGGDFHDQQSFSKFLQQSISLKRLQNQRKYLGNK